MLIRMPGGTRPERLIACVATTIACGLLALWASMAAAQNPRNEPVRPGWCQQLPRPEYKKLARVGSADPWFEVYRIRPGVFAIYEPRQWEEVISYLILGQQPALLFDYARARKAFADVKAGRVTSVLTDDGYREYRFQGFSLLLAAARSLRNSSAVRRGP